MLSGLGNESKRWEVKARDLKDDFKNLTGNILISAALMAYLGPFTLNYRDEMVKKWHRRVKELKIPVIADKYSFERILADPVKIREWEMAGLPAD